MYKLYTITYIDTPRTGMSVTQTKILIPAAVYATLQRVPENDYKTLLKAITRGHEFFTEKSPLFAAMQTGILVTEYTTTKTIIN